MQKNTPADIDISLRLWDVTQEYARSFIELTSNKDFDIKTMRCFNFKKNTFSSYKIDSFSFFKRKKNSFTVCLYLDINDLSLAFQVYELSKKFNIESCIRVSLTTENYTDGASVPVEIKDFIVTTGVNIEFSVLFY